MLEEAQSIQVESHTSKIQSLVKVAPQKILEKHTEKHYNFKEKVIEKARQKINKPKLIEEGIENFEEPLIPPIQKVNDEVINNQLQQKKLAIHQLKGFFEQVSSQVFEQSSRKMNNFAGKLFGKQKKNIKTIEFSRPQSNQSEKNLNDPKVQLMSNTNDIVQVKKSTKNRTLSHREKIKQIVNSPEGHQKAQDLIKRMNQQRRDQIKKKQFIEQRKMEKMTKEENEIMQTRKEQEDQQREQRVRIISEKLLNERDIRNFQSQTNKEGNKIIKQIQQRIQEEELDRKRKEEELMRPELEKRKAELARKRKISQPVHLDELREHQKKYEAEKKSKNLERERHKLEVQLDGISKLNLYPKSQAMLQIEEEEKRLKEQQQHAEDARKLKRERQTKYVEVIRDVFQMQPKKKSTEKSQLQIDNSQFIIADIGLNNIRKIQRAMNKNSVPPPLRKVHQTYDPIQLDEEQKQFFVPDAQNSQQSRLSELSRKRKISQQTKTPVKNLINQDESQIKTQRIDYLKELRSQRIKSGIEINQATEWEKYVSNDKLQSKEKLEGVMAQITKLEEKAKLKEKIASQTRDLHDEEEASYLYINSIKAKLALLDNKKT